METERKPVMVATCSCTHLHTDHSFVNLVWRDCLIDPCHCRRFDGKGKVVDIEPKKKYDGGSSFKPKTGGHPQ